MIQRALDYLFLTITAVTLQVAVTLLKRMNRSKATNAGWPTPETRSKAA
jgi:hypothetical protein